MTLEEVMTEFASNNPPRTDGATLVYPYSATMPNGQVVWIYDDINAMNAAKANGENAVLESDWNNLQNPTNYQNPTDPTTDNTGGGSWWDAITNEASQIKDWGAARLTDIANAEQRLEGVINKTVIDPAANAETNAGNLLATVPVLLTVAIIAVAYFAFTGKGNLRSVKVG